MITSHQLDRLQNYLSTYEHPEDLREMLQDYEQSKWVKFNSKDTTTWPPVEKWVLVLTSIDYNIDYISQKPTEWYNSIQLDRVTHWQCLPAFTSIEG